jgi:hypothetical protein
MTDWYLFSSTTCPEMGHKEKGNGPSSDNYGILVVYFSYYS